MTSFTRRKAGLAATGAILAGLAAPAAARAAPLDVFYERTVMTAADARCRLFAPPVGAALASGQAQARNTALRAGSPESVIDATEQRARAKAAAVDCASADLETAAERVRNAFEGYSKITRMRYPGDMGDWRADRGAGRTIRWRLAQDAAFGWDRMIFGLAGRDGEGVLIAVADFADGARPYTARLVMRDADRSQGAYLDRRGADLSGRMPLARRMPAGFALKAYTAVARSTADDDLAPKTMKSPWAFRFPQEAAARLALLDPRESVAVEFVMPDGEVRRAYVEVGDFAAGRAFLKLAQR
jgi:hypothetical protein